MDHVPQILLGWLGRAFLLVLPLACGPVHALYAGQAKPTYSRAVLVRMEGMITPRLQRYLERKLQEAKDLGADLLIVEIDSPGGMLDPSERIAYTLKDLPWARTVAFVPYEAISGAAIASLGCDEIVMGPQARIGDAGPIYLDEDFLFRHAPEKIRSDLIQVARTLAQAKGRPPALAEAMIDMHVVVFEARNKQTGKTAYMNNHEWESLNDKDRWEKGPPVLESNRGVFLELAGTKAVELGLAQALAANRDQLKQHYQLGDLVVIEPTAVDTAVEVLNWWFVTAVLFIVGLIGIYIEFCAPGTCLGGVLAAVCFGLFFWSHALGGTAGWLEVVLFLLGAAFLAIEIFLLPGAMIAGITGVVLMLTSLVMATQTSMIPQTVWQWREMGASIAVVGGSFLAFFFVGIFLTWYFGTVPILSRLVLAPPTSEAAAGTPTSPATTLLSSAAVAGRAVGGTSDRPWLAIGQIGIAVSPLRPAGKVQFGEELADVLTEGDFVDQGSRVRIYRVQGTTIIVRQIADLS